MTANKQTPVASATGQISVETPYGVFIITASGGKVCAISRASEGNEQPVSLGATQPVLQLAAKELREYLAGERMTFTFPMGAEGTPFQQKVWAAISQIPYGETRTYGEIAQVVENPKGSRAVGMACNKNPIMIAVPCHRVMGAGGKLTGYAYGTGLKHKLLSLEQREPKEDTEKR